MVVLYVAVECEDAMNWEPSVILDGMHERYVCFHHSFNIAVNSKDSQDE